MARPVWLGEDKHLWDHIRVHTTLLEDTRLSIYDVMVWLGIAYHANIDEGEAWPDQVTLARVARCGISMVQKSIKNLTNCGWIKVARMDQKRGRPLTYQLLSPPALCVPRTDNKTGVLPVPQQPITGTTYVSLPVPHTDAFLNEQEPIEQEPLNKNQKLKDLKPLAILPNRKGDENRKRDLLFDALISELKIREKDLTGSTRGAINKSLKELRSVGATAEEIHRRCENYRLTWPTITLTASALVKHWAILSSASSPKMSENQQNAMNVARRRGLI